MLLRSLIKRPLRVWFMTTTPLAPAMRIYHFVNGRILGVIDQEKVT